MPYRSRFFGTRMADDSEKIWKKMIGKVSDEDAQKIKDDADMRIEMAKMAYRLGPGFNKQVQGLKSLIAAEKKRRGTP